eukprot:1181327-Prorocentrum_minimum.AAC.2
MVSTKYRQGVRVSSYDALVSAGSPRRAGFPARRVPCSPGLGSLRRTLATNCSNPRKSKRPNPRGAVHGVKVRIWSMVYGLWYRGAVHGVKAHIWCMVYGIGELSTGSKLA